MKAVQIGDAKKSGSGAIQKHYRLDPPMQTEYGLVEHVVVSAVVAMFTGPETYIFEADSSGNLVRWSELDGSYRGGLDHCEALRNAGYSVEVPTC